MMGTEWRMGSLGILVAFAFTLLPQGLSSELPPISWSRGFLYDPNPPERSPLEDLNPPETEEPETPPEPEPELPSLTQEIVCPAKCELRPPGPRDYALLFTLGTGLDEKLDDLPDYIRRALYRDSVASGQRINIADLLRYIEYPDWRNLVLLLFQNAVNRRDIARDELSLEPDLTDYRRFFFIEELTGYQFANYGIPEREPNGDLRLLSAQPNWMARVGIEFVDLPTIYTMLTPGLVNRDPRIRLGVLAILIEMGPTPRLLNTIFHAGGLTRAGLETVGNARYGFFSLNGVVEDGQSQRQCAGETDRCNVLTRRYCFCDLDGINRDAVPFVSFVQFGREIARLKLAYDIEVTGRADEEYFRVIPHDVFRLLDEPASFQGYYGVDRTTRFRFFGPQRYHSQRELDPNYLGYRFREIEYPAEPVEFRDQVGEEMIPFTRYLEGQSSFRFLVRRVMWPPANVALTSSYLAAMDLDADTLDDLLFLMAAALDNRSYSVRLQAAENIFRLYATGQLDRIQERQIFQWMLDNSTLREIMLEALRDFRVEDNVRLFLGYEDFDSLRRDLAESDREARLWRRAQENQINWSAADPGNPDEDQPTSEAATESN